MNDKKLNKLVIFCGGTGGHFFPGLTIARTLKEQNREVVLITGGHRNNYRELYSSKYKLEIKEVCSARFSISPLKAAIFFVKFIIGFFQTMLFLIRFKPDAALAMGSYTSIPGSLAVLLSRTPLFLHDGNAVIGKANRLLSRWAKCLMLTFPVAGDYKVKIKTKITGMPLRLEILSGKKIGKTGAIKLFNDSFNADFSEDKPTILIFGGSLGARTLNTVIPKVLVKSFPQVQIIHLTGKNDLRQTRELYSDSEQKVVLLEQSDNMALLYSVADIVVSRSGGSTISELAFFHKPAILIPYPYASENHQYYNALFYVESNMAEIIENDKCTEELVTVKILEFIKKYFNQKVNFKDLSRPNAATDIINTIFT